MRVPGAGTKHWFFSCSSVRVPAQSTELRFFLPCGCRHEQRGFVVLSSVGVPRIRCSCECRPQTILFRVGGRHNNVLSRVSRRALAFRHGDTKGSQLLAFMRSTRTTCRRGSNQEHTVVGTRCFRAVPGPSRVVSRVRGSRRAQLLSFFRAWVRTVVCRCFSFACAGTAGPRCRGARACLVSRTHGCFVSCVQALCAGHEPLFCVARAGHQVLCGTEPFCSVCAGTSAGFWARAAVFLRAGTNSSSRGKPLLSRGTKQAESVQAREWSLCKHKKY